MERFTVKEAIEISKEAKLRDNRIIIAYRENINRIKKYAGVGDTLCEFAMHEDHSVNNTVSDMLREDGFHITVRLGVMTIEWPYNKNIIDVKLSKLQPGDVEGVPYVRERDVVTIHTKTGDDGYPEPYMTINGKGGYGHGAWVLHGDREMLHFKCMFGVIVAYDFQHLVRRIAEKFASFEHVEVKGDIGL